MAWAGGCLPWLQRDHFGLPGSLPSQKPLSSTTHVEKVSCGGFSAGKPLREVVLWHRSCAVGSKQGWASPHHVHTWEDKASRACLGTLGRNEAAYGSPGLSLSLPLVLSV